MIIITFLTKLIIQYEIFKLPTFQQYFKKNNIYIYMFMHFFSIFGLINDF